MEVRCPGEIFRPDAVRQYLDTHSEFSARMRAEFMPFIQPLPKPQRRTFEDLMGRLKSRFAFLSDGNRNALVQELSAPVSDEKTRGHGPRIGAF